MVGMSCVCWDCCLFLAAAVAPLCLFFLLHGFSLCSQG